jgi:glycosyltransferase involved in cell wall biosynthesis
MAAGSPPPHAVLLSPTASGNAGGVERYTNMVADILREDGWRVSTVAPTHQPGRWTFRLGGSPLVWSTSAGRAAKAADPSPSLLIANGFLGLAAPRGGHRIQIFHGTSIGETLIARHGYTPQDFLRRLVSYWPVEALTARAGTLVVTSETAAQETARYYRRSGDALIPSGVDERAFHPRDRAQARARLGIETDRTLALFAGRIEYRKGGDLLAESCARADVQLMVAGRTGVPGAHHLGALDTDELAWAYAAADLLLFPTRYESCSLTILEAMACAIPVVTTRVAWMRTFLRALPDYDALCVEPAVADIAARLRSFDAQAAQPLARRAREWVIEHNGVQAFNRMWRELIERVTCAG